MLTMLHIEPDGTESVKEIKGFMKKPAKDSITNSDYLIYWCPNNDEYGVEIHDGRVFIMNENGKTIANYVVCSEWKQETIGIIK